MDYKQIDKDIRELIRWINVETKYETIFSCSSHPEKGNFKGYVSFKYTDETVVFLNKVLDKLANRFKLLAKLDSDLEVLYYDFNIVILYNGYGEKMVELNVNFINVYNYYKVVEKEPVEDFNKIVKDFWRELKKVMEEVVKEL